MTKGQAQTRKRRPRPQRAQAASQPLDLGRLPDWAVIDTKQTSHATGLSADTLRRLSATQKGPPRTRLSERRIGYVVGALRGWLREREEKQGGR